VTGSTAAGAALGIDVGSTNVKVALVRADGTVAGTASRPLATTRNGDAVTQDPVALFDAVVGAVGEVCATHRNVAATVASVGVCSQYSSTVPVDAAGMPVADMVLYLDRRGTEHCWDIITTHDTAFALWIERHGIPPVGGGLSLGHMLWMQHDRPDIHNAAAAYLEPMDYVVARLTGRICATQGTMFTSQLCDNRTLGTTSYDPDLVALSGVDPSRLPELIAPDAVVGEVLGSLAEAWGIPASATVAAAMNDSHAGAFATGAYRGATGGLMVGTTSVLLDNLDHTAADLAHEIVAMPSPVPGTWLVWAENGLAGRAVDHVLSGLVHTSDVLGQHATANPFAALDDALASVPAGSDGVLFLPWLAGSMAPAASSGMRGGFINLTLDTGRTHLVRAAIEGTALNAGWLLPAVESLTGRTMSSVVLGGGAARSAGWAQVFADVLDRPVCPVVDPDTAVARAVALVAIMGPTAAASDPNDVMVRTSGIHHPDPAHRATYDAAQRRFVAAFEALRPLAEELGT
jgi:xylulokinase